MYSVHQLCWESNEVRFMRQRAREVLEKPIIVSEFEFKKILQIELMISLIYSLIQCATRRTLWEIRRRTRLFWKQYAEHAWDYCVNQWRMYEEENRRELRIRVRSAAILKCAVIVRRRSFSENVVRKRRSQWKQRRRDIALISLLNRRCFECAVERVLCGSSLFQM